MKKTYKKIIIFNEKGGTGKTSIARELSLNLKYKIYELDPYGSLHKYLNNVEFVGLDKITKFDEFCIFDFGGFYDKRIKDIAKKADIIIIPYNPTIGSLATTIETYHKIKKFNLPVIFVANSYFKEEDFENSQEFLKENIREEIMILKIANSRAIQTAENEGVSILSLLNRNGLSKHIYKKIANEIKEIIDILQ